MAGIGEFMKKGLSVIKAFGKQAKASVGNIRAARDTATTAFGRDIGVRTVKELAPRVGRGMGKVGRFLSNNPVSRAAKFTVKTGVKTGFRVASSYPGLALGATAMMGLSVMKGGMDQSREIVHERYMQDYMYSRNMLHNSRVGLASGTSRMLDRGGTMGLSNALHKTRHGKY